MRRTLRRTGVLALAAMALAGCTARTGVDIDVTSATSARVDLSVEFTGEVAAALREDPELLASLSDTFENRSGVSPEVHSTDDSVLLAAPVDYDHLEASGAVTGVSGLTLSGTGHAVQAEVTLRDAPDLLQAIAAGTADQPDAQVIAETMAQTTLLQVRVRFPGGLAADPQVAGVDASAVSVDGTSVTVVRTADSAGAGSVVVTGDPAAPTNWPWLAGGGALVALAVVLVVARRRDRADPRTAGL